ncbi:MAG: transposase [Deferribacteres bacterium]|nr:transposase [Deferribacteres bacterium]
MIDREHELPLTRQREILELSRSSLYYKAVPVNPRGLEIMKVMEKIHLKYPFMGSRSIRDELRDRGYNIGRDHVRTLMRKMGIEAIYKRPRLSKPHPGHKIYPYLLRGLEISSANHIWAADITYLPMARGVVLSCGDHGLGKPEGFILAAVQHTGCVFLYRGVGGSCYEIWSAGNIQQRSGETVHLRGLYRDSQCTWDKNQHGWPGPLDGQHHDRAVMEKREVRRCVFEGI